MSKEIYYEDQDEHGKYYINEDETVYRPNEPVFKRFEKMLEDGQVEVKPYSGSPVETKKQDEEKERADSIEKGWAAIELQKLNEELLDTLYDSQPQLKAHRDSLKGYIDNPGQPRPTR